MIVYNYSRGDIAMDFSFKLRCLVFNEWLMGGYGNISRLCKKYGMSRKWFYKFKKRFERYGFEGLKDKIRRFPSMPHALSLDKKLIILDYVCDKPRHGAKNITINLALKGIRISEGAIWNYLSSEDLNTRRKRKLWAYGQGKDVLTDKEKHIMKAKKNHIESRKGGELIGVDTFTVSIKNLGKLWQFTGCDTYSSYGWAKIYDEKTSDNAVDFVLEHIVSNAPEGKIQRVVTDRGSEFYSWRSGRLPHNFTDKMIKNGIKHTLTKVAHPWTNGYAERLNQTIWQEFYLPRLSRQFDSIEDLQKELDAFMVEYNFKRMHMGYKLKAGGYKFPGHAFFDTKEACDVIEIKY